MRPRTLAVAAVSLVAALSIAAPYFRAYTRAATLIVRLAGLTGPAAQALSWERENVTVSDVAVDSRHGRLRARLYVPDHVRRAVVLVAGVNELGIDEPRLYGLADELARAGLAVLTPELPDLQRYDITARTTDMIEDAGVWLSQQRRLARDGRVGLMGISFSGGLSVVAAGRPAMRSRVAFVFSFGGYGSFPRVLRFLCTGMEPAAAPLAAATRVDGAETYRRPHDYGVVILLLGLAPRLVPAEQVQPLRTAILTFLRASHLELIDQRKATEVFADARRMNEALPEPARRFMRDVNQRNVTRLGLALEPWIGTIGLEPALSPDWSPPPAVPVYLLHGTEDNVVPSVESLMLDRYLAGRTRVRVLLSGLITHAELDHAPRAGDVWKLVDFFADMLRE